MSYERAKSTPAYMDRRYIEYHAVLEAQGRGCGCCPGKLDAAEVKRGYEQARRKAEKAKQV